MRFLLLSLFMCGAVHAQVPAIPFVTQRSGSPIPLTGMIIWADQKSGSVFYNSSGSTSPANNDKIASYTDISGNHFDITNSGASANMGVFKTGAGPPGGAPYVQFANAASGTGLSNMLNSTTYSQPSTFYFVWLDNIAGANETAFDSSFNSQSARNVFYFTTGGGGQTFLFAGQNSADVGTLRSASWNVSTVQFNGSSSLWRTNGVVGQSGLNPLGNGIKGFIVGNSQAGNQSADLSLAAMVFYNVAHDATTMHSIETFLGNEYGITIH